MKKRIFSLVLALILCLNLVVFASAEAGFANFKTANSYAGHFTDVSDSAWYVSYVKQAYEYGLVNGSSKTTFSPDANLNLAQTITLAARLHSIYATGAEPDGAVPAGGKWYDPYVSYALENGIIKQPYASYDAAAKRSEVAVIFAAALPQSAFPEIRTVSDGAIPDVATSAAYSGAVYTLYRAGILSGNDTSGTFTPDSSIKRSEIAAICVRIADPAQRSTAAVGKTVETGEKLTAEEIAEKCSPAVFYIECYAFNGYPFSSGSGFFISSDGLALTNYHVIANTSELVAMTPDGKTYSDIEILDLDEDNDLALIKIKGSGFPYLEMGDSSTLKQGQRVYAIGSPSGLDNSFTDGLVSNTSRIFEEDGTPYVQTTADMTHGSSGGALINEYGKVIAINTAIRYAYGANLNLSVPINIAKLLDRSSTASLVCWSGDYYEGFTAAYDFGLFSHVTLLKSASSRTHLHHKYDVFDFVSAEHYTDTLSYYRSALLKNGFVQEQEGENYFDGVYANHDAQEIVIISIDLYYEECIDVLAIKSPVYYDGFPSLIDFGWFTGLPVSTGPTVVENSTMYVYNWLKYTNADTANTLFLSYAMYLLENGYKLIAVEPGLILMEDDSLSVVLIMDETSFYFDIQTL